MMISTLENPYMQIFSKIRNIIHICTLAEGGRIAAGSEGSIWHVRAKDEQGREVHLACKVDSPIASDNRNEINSLRFVDHPNIVSVRDVITIPDQKTGFPFSRVLIFMDLCGGNLNKLREKCPQKRMPERACKHWFRQIAGALNYLHNEFKKGGMDTTHGDVKMENILHYEFLWDNQAVVDEQTVVAMTFKLCDFGLSRCFFGWNKVEVDGGRTIDLTRVRQKGVKDDLARLLECLEICLFANDKEQKNYYQVAKNLGLSRKLLNLMWRMRYKFSTMGEVLAHPWLRQ